MDNHCNRSNNYYSDGKFDIKETMIGLCYGSAVGIFISGIGYAAIQGIGYFFN